MFGKFRRERAFFEMLLQFFQRSAGIAPTASPATSGNTDRNAAVSTVIVTGCMLSLLWAKIISLSYGPGRSPVQTLCKRKMLREGEHREAACLPCEAFLRFEDVADKV
jgi:hypothetical protein